MEMKPYIYMFYFVVFEKDFGTIKKKKKKGKSLT